MSDQDFETSEVVRLEVGQRNSLSGTGLPTNAVKNPSGYLGSWGWLTPAATTFLDPLYGAPSIYSGQGLKLYGGGAQTNTWTAYTEPEPASPGSWWVAGLTPITKPPSGTGVDVRIRWLDANRALISSPAGASFGNSVTIGTEQKTIAHQAPAGTAFVQLWVDLKYLAAGPAKELSFWKAFLSTAAGPGGSATFTEPYTFRNVLETATKLDVDRPGGLQPGYLKADFLSTALDPSTANTLRPGYPVRLLALDNDELGVELIANGDFETTVTGWTANNGNLTASSASGAQKGVNAGRYVSTVAGNNWVQLTDKLVVSSGQKLTPSLWLKLITQASAYQLQLVYYAGAAVLTTVSVTKTAAQLSTAAFTQISLGEQTVPRGATDVVLKVLPADPIAVGSGYAIDSVSMKTPAFAPLFTGEILNATVQYRLTENDETKRARVQLSSVDPTKTLANTKQRVGVRTVRELAYLTEGAGVPWSLDGQANQIAGAANMISDNENATLLDQVGLVQNTTLGYAWVSRWGQLNVVTPAVAAGDSTASKFTEADYLKDVVVDFDTSRAINEVIVKDLSLDGTGKTVETISGPFRRESSIREWGRFVQEFTRNTPAADPAASYAGRILDANATPKRTLRELKFNVVTKADDFRTTSQVPAGSMVFRKRAHLDLYDKVRVVNARAAIDQDLRVTSLRHTITPKRWTVTVGFDAVAGVAMPAPGPPAEVGANALPGFQDTAWAGLPMINGWVDYDNTQYGPARYCRRNGVVYLTGLVSQPTPANALTVVCVLPAGFRPSRTVLAVVFTSAGPVRVNMDAGGQLFYSSAAGGAPPGAYNSVHISYPAEQ